MKSLLIICFVLCAVAANPVPEKDIDMLRIPLEGDKELDVLTLADNSGKISERNKRTLEILRGLFPSLTESLQQLFQRKISLLFRTIGPLLLRGGAVMGTPVARSNFDDDFDDDDTSKNDNGGAKVSISLPTYPPDEDDEDNETENENDKGNDKENEIKSLESSIDNKEKIELNESTSDSSDKENTTTTTSATTTTTTTTTTTPEITTIPKTTKTV